MLKEVYQAVPCGEGDIPVGALILLGTHDPEEEDSLVEPARHITSTVVGNGTRCDINGQMRK